jgi:P-type Cu+ transporter
MTRALPAPAPAPVDVPDPEPPRTPRRMPGRTTTCTALTVVALVLAVVVAGPVGGWAALAVSAVVVGWGGWPLYRAARAGLRRGGLVADALPGAGIAASAAAACAVAGPSAPLPLVVAATVTTLLLAGREAQGRAAWRAEAALLAGVAAAGPAEPTKYVQEPASDDATAAEARRGAATVGRVADRAAGGFARIVIALAVATLGFWLGAGAGTGPALGAAAAVLLAACPRVIGAAASAALLAGTGRAVELGARPSAPRVLERAARADTVVLCRTGTLTTGARALHAVHAADDVDPDEALRLAGAVAAAAQEAGGTAGRHAVGAVVAQAACARFGALPGVAEFDGYPGLGVRGVVTELRGDQDGAAGEPRVLAHATLVGRPALLAEHGIALPPELEEAVGRVHDAGSTAVTVSWDGVARAVFEVADPIRADAKEAVRRLRALGLVPVLLTGDDAGVARGLAAKVGVDPDDVLAEVPRTRRAAAVDGLRSRGRTVAVIGGPADGDALAAADVALVHDGGSPSADGVALRDADPLTAVDAVHLASRAIRTVERVGTGTLAYHLVALPLAAAGLLPPPVAALAAAILPVAGVARAAALRRVRATERPTGP